MIENKEISKNILATISYYDAFSYPLTAFEIWKYLIRMNYFEDDSSKNISLKLIIKEIKKETLAKFISEKNGFYFLKGREGIVNERIENSKTSFLKNRRLKRVIKLLKYVPFIRMIGVTGRLSMKNAKSGSDWDLFIVIKDGRIWIGRTLITIFAHIIGKRRHGIKIKDRVCLNYFVCEKSMEISMKDFYAANEYFFMYPIFGWEVFKKFQLKNGWISSIKTNYMPSEIEPQGIVKDNIFSRQVRFFGEILFDWNFLEKFLRDIEKKKIMLNPKTRQEGAFINASDDALVFLPELKGPRIFDEFKKRIENLG